MLELLHIENIAVIEAADIQFRPGFNALTGETGAGKSIVIDAMGAVLGGRTSRDLIRTGAAKAFVSAEFSAVPAELPGLRENGLAPDEDGNLLLQREISGDGKNACRVNGRPITVAQLRQIGGELVSMTALSSWMRNSTGPIWTALARRKRFWEIIREPMEFSRTSGTRSGPSRWMRRKKPAGWTASVFR